MFTRSSSVRCLWRGLLVFGFVLKVSSSALAVQHSHQSSIPEVCKDKTQPASQACARAPGAFMDHIGRLWLAWAHNNHVYVQYSDDQGKSYHIPVKVNKQAEPVAARGENRPKIAVDRRGRIFVSWTMKLAKRFSGHIRFSRSLDNGKTFSVPVTVNDHLEETSHRFEAMSVNDKGEIFIAWLDKRDLLAAQKAGQDYSGAAVYYSYSDNHGKSFHPNIKIADSSCQCCRVAMAIEQDGLPVILWRHIFGKNIRDHALAKLLKKNIPGKVKRASVDNWQVDGCPHHGPSISVDKYGTYHLAWFTGAKDQAGLFYAYSSDQGQTYSRPLHFGKPSQQAAHPQVMTTGDKVYLLWKTFDGSLSHLELRVSSDRGRNWSKTMRVDSNNAMAGYPQLVAHDSKVYAAWHIPGQGFKVIPLDFKTGIQ